MAGRRGDSHRVIRWLWTSRGLDAKVMRLSLLPLSACWWAWTRARAAIYASEWLPVSELPLPAVAVGNLTVGGSGKTPIAMWVARHFASNGHTPGILHRGYGGGDEALVHERALAGAPVVTDPDRLTGARKAMALGAKVLVLDDAYQRLELRPKLNLLVMSAEATRAVSWTLPAGPWREDRTAVRRANLVVVTRKRASPEAARSLAASLKGRTGVPVAITRLVLARLNGLRTGQAVPATALAGRRVLAASGIADPESFVSQVKATGAAVQAATWGDHHPYSPSDVSWLARVADRVDHVVVTEKDAVKLRERWPADAPEPLVAALDLEWEDGVEAVLAALDGVVPPLAHPEPRLETP